MQPEHLDLLVPGASGAVRYDLAIANDPTLLSHLFLLQMLLVEMSLVERCVFLALAAAPAISAIE